MDFDDPGPCPCCKEWPIFVAGMAVGGVLALVVLLELVKWVGAA